MDDFSWTTEEALGKELLGYSEEGNNPKIIGVVKNFHFRSFQEVVRPQMFHQFEGTDVASFFVKMKPGDPAMAIAEIATNQKVEGGGEYYIISRSFGLVIGSTIGIALYMSQAISVAFYIMAFAEAFNTLIQYLTATYDLPDTVLWLLSKKQSDWFKILTDCR